MELKLEHTTKNARGREFFFNHFNSTEYYSFSFHLCFCTKVIIIIIVIIMTTYVAVAVAVAAHTCSLTNTPSILVCMCCVYTCIGSTPCTTTKYEFSLNLIFWIVRLCRMCAMCRNMLEQVSPKRQLNNKAECWTNVARVNKCQMEKQKSFGGKP